MTQQELDYIAQNVAEILYARVSKSVFKRVDEFCWRRFEDTKIEKKINTDAFFSCDENQFFNYKTQRQFRSVKLVMKMKDFCLDRKVNDDMAKYFATESQFYACKRRVMHTQINNYLVMSVAGAGGFVNKKIYNYHQTEPIPDAEWIKPEKRANARYQQSKLRKEMIAEANNRCQICKQVFPAEKLDLDHIKPLSLGGKTTKKNLQVVCHICNCKKSNKVL